MMIAALMVTNLVLLQGSLDINAAAPPVPSSEVSTFSVIAIISALAWGLGYPGQPHILARFMATRSTRDIRSAGLIAVSWTFVCLCSAVAIGYLASRHPILGSYAGDPEKIFIIASEFIFHPLIAGVVTAAILAAIMSTADSQLIIAASALYYDLFTQSHTSPRPPASWLRGIRIVTALLGLISVIFAWNPQSTVLGLVAYAWAGFGASFGPAVILSVFATRVSGRAIFFGMLSGAVTVILWEQQNYLLTDLYSLVPGFTANLLAVAVVSMFPIKRIRA